MDELLGFICDILTKKAIEGVTIKTEQVFNKIKLHLVPKETVPDYDISFEEGGKMKCMQPKRKPKQNQVET